MCVVSLNSQRLKVQVDKHRKRNYKLYGSLIAILAALPLPLRPWLDMPPHLSPFEVGQIKAHSYHGLSAHAISALVVRQDKSHPSVQNVLDVVNRLRDHPSWRGQRLVGSGRLRATTPKLDKQILRTVLKHRGSSKVTVAFVRKILPATRKLSEGTIQNRLHDSGLAWLRRRRKTLVPKKYLADRCAFAASVLRRHQGTLDRWAYADGATFFLDKATEANESTQRAALGRFVWRRADRSDSLYVECVGPSAYNKAQGEPVRVWGVLAEGQLHTYIMPKGECMNRWWYAWLIRRFFKSWMGGCVYVAQDFERCLRCEEPMEAFKEIGVQLVPDYPRCSQDLNAIENAWKLLRDRLDETLPPELEDREAFSTRVRNAVTWLNKNRRDELLMLSTNQKARAREVLTLKGGRTKW